MTLSEYERGYRAAQHRALMLVQRATDPEVMLKIELAQPVPAEPYPPRGVCTACGAPLELLGEGRSAIWVDARSGDDGGTYDICPERYDEATDTQHGHTP